MSDHTGTAKETATQRAAGPAHAAGQVKATGEFSISAWDESTFTELTGGAKLNKAHVTFGLTGDLEGEGRWEVLMCYLEDGSAEFTGYQLTVGKLGGREGEFVLRADGSYASGEARMNWEVVPGSGTGGLRGLRGRGQAVSVSAPGGTFSLEYQLDQA